MRKKVLAALSGGVDSSVAAFLLAEAGYAVTGLTMRLGVKAEEEQVRCCAPEAVDDARRVCDRLKIPHSTMDFSKTMEEWVIEPFVREYARGRTPNPCIDCNRYLKFGRLLEMARSSGFDYLATGHYARIEESSGRYRLLRAKDRMKDQTYFLYPIRVGDLPSVLFPLGGLAKEEVRAIARKARLPVAEKAESQDLCFVGRGGHELLIRQRGMDVKPGSIVDRDGCVLGQHRGIVFYTIGQRSGLGLSVRRPLYVLEIDAFHNRIVVGMKKNLSARGLLAVDLNLLAEDWPARGEAKIRYRKTPVACDIEQESGCLRIRFVEPQEAVAPGQSVVLYQGDHVLGGGVIKEAISEHN